MLGYVVAVFTGWWDWCAKIESGKRVECGGAGSPHTADSGMTSSRQSSVVDCHDAKQPHLPRIRMLKMSRVQMNDKFGWCASCGPGTYIACWKIARRPKTDGGAGKRLTLFRY